MELEHSFTIPVPPERAWPVLLDVQRIAPCMPGATVDSVDGEEIKGRIKVKVGPVSLTYSGTARFTERDEQARAITLDASGKETRGSGTASATVRSTLQDEGSGTKVVVHTTLSVTGRPAQFGRGVMAEVGGRIIERFATNLAALLATGGAAEATDGPSAAGSGDASGNGATSSGAGRSGAAMSNGAGPGAAAAGPAATEAEPQRAGAARGVMPLEELRLPVRAYNSLRREGIHTVDELSARTEAELLGVENLGPQSVKEIKQRLADVGRNLASPAGDGQDTAAAPAAQATAAPAGDGAGEARPAAPPLGARPPDEDAIDLLSVAGFPVLKRALPVAGALVAMALIVLRRRGRRRRSR